MALVPNDPELAMVLAQDRAGYDTRLPERDRTKLAIAFQHGWKACEQYMNDRGLIAPCEHA